MKIINALADSLGVTVEELVNLSKDAPKKYKVYKIPKRSSGFRLIAQPSKDIKKLQRSLVPILSEYLSIHASAQAYKNGSSIKKNAAIHKNNRYLLKMDISNFFNSITPEILLQQITKKYNIEELEFEVIKNISFWNPSKKSNSQLVLSVGAPSSPFISNAVLYSFDVAVDIFSGLFGISYSRYADDLTFSTNNKDILFQLEKIINTELESQFDSKLSINRQKTIFTSKRHNRHVTGVTINNDSELSIGRKRKRIIKHLVHNFIVNKLNKDEILHLQGLLSFAQHIDPSFQTSLANKYGKDIVQSIKAQRFL